MLPFQPAVASPVRGRVVAKPLGQAAAPAVPPPGPDPLFTGYTGIRGFVEAVLVLGVTSAAAFVGIKTGMGNGSRALRGAGWLGGVGSAIAGILYLGAKSGLGDQVGLPAVRVTPY